MLLSCDFVSPVVHPTASPHLSFRLLGSPFLQQLEEKPTDLPSSTASGLIHSPPPRSKLGASWGSCPSPAPFLTVTALCWGPPLAVPWGWVQPPPSLPPGAEKVSQIFRNRSGGGGGCVCISGFDVTPARPTGAAQLP